MENLRIKLFAEAVEDVERTKYKILARLSAAYDAFEDGSIHPHLRYLVEVREEIEQYFKNRDALRSDEAGNITGIDLGNEEIQREWPEFDDNSIVGDVEALMKWAFPKIDAAVEDGKEVRDEVKEDLSLKTVGIEPSYRAEGYVLVPDHEDSSLRVYAYKTHVLTEDGASGRTVQTTERWAKPADAAPEDVKRHLLDVRPDLPVPATFHVEIDRRVPHETTLLPITKRTLTNRLRREG
jgi:hypothetical protein